MASTTQAKAALIESNERKVTELNRLIETREATLRAAPGQDPALAPKEDDENRKALVSYEAEIRELRRMNEALRKQIR
jgi:hypothetical protein